MRTVTLKGLWAYKRRLLGTLLAVFLGIAFLSGTLVLGDTMRATFDDLFTEANAGTDVVVRRASELGTDPGEADTQRGLIDESLAGTLRAVDGVAAVEPYVEGYGQIVTADGTRLGGNGPPTLAANWVDEPELNPYRLADGRAPRTAGEVVIDRGAAQDGDLEVGDRATVLTPEPVDVEVVGIATFGSADSLGRVTFTAFTLDEAQQLLLGEADRVSSLPVRGAAGVAQEELARRVERVLPDDVEAITGVELTDETTNDINEQFLDLFTTFLVIFAAIALLVATFSIFNTFSILVAQRTRESALLRAVGATRSQVLASVVIESLLVGVVASVVGLVGGFGVAGLLKALLDTFGFSVPAGGLVLERSTVVISLVVGVAVTLVAGIAPAVRASRVAPLAALRDVAIDRAHASTRRVVGGLVLTGVGVVVVLSAVIGGGGSVLARAGLGALLTIVGVVVFGPVVARPASAILGAPVARLRGITGALARENAMRNPRRTAGTAAALTVGVAVVTMFTVFAASLKASIDDSVSRSFTGDLVITSGQFGGGGLSPQLASDLDALTEVDTATGLGTGRARIGSGTETVTVVEPGALGDVLDLEVQRGAIDGLGDRDIAVSDAVADDEGWDPGTTVPVTFSDGTTTRFTVAVVFDANEIVGDYLLPRAAWAPHAIQDLDTTVLVSLAEGVGVGTARAAVDEVVDAFQAPDALDRDEYVDSVAGNVDTMLSIVYALLALAILIALMGIANTLALSMYERTRELGLLRAVGQTRRQLRSMVRWESVIIAVFGTIGGVGLGVFLGWALVEASSAGSGDMLAARFAAPVTQLVVVLVVGAVAGVLAGLRPARRAARLPVLQAIAAE